MTRWAEERRAAHELRSCAVPEGTILARDVIDAVQRFTQIAHQATYEGDDVLDGALAQLDVEMNTIWYSAAIQPALLPFYLGHEYAHLQLNHGSCRGDAGDIDVEATGTELDAGVERVQGYSPQERRERAANVFAQELLLPTPLLRRWFLDDGLGATAIAQLIGLDASLVRRQLTAALLDVSHNTAVLDDGGNEIYEEALGAGEAASPTNVSPSVSADLDHSQAVAAYVDHGPFLLEAGPGTGKTRTLIARIVYLLAHGARPNQIVVLTFSNRAAAEIRDRVALSMPEAAADLWVGTFHAFGLELLRQYGPRFGLPKQLDVLDPFRALQFLEENLLQLGLTHYQRLSRPSEPLRDIAKAISRAKDELCDPDEYRGYAEKMLIRARDGGDDEAILVAEKALEVARVYRVYQDHLERSGLVDFGDLVARTVKLLRGDPALRDEIRDRYRYVLVDEYQDVNHASTELLRELAGAGEGLWVVGDPHQAIYRFRGADPTNVARFTEHFPTARRSALRFNYRSRPAVVEVVSGLARVMKATDGSVPEPWRPTRTDSRGEVALSVAATFESEMAGIIAAIRRYQAAKVRFRDQAILCRTHTILGRVAEALKAAGIPTQYFGNLFEREETRDMLSLLSLVAEADGVSLIRVATFPEYAIPAADVARLLDAARDREIAFPQALSLTATLPDLSDEGRAGLKRLAGHLGDIAFPTGPWGFLSSYLLEVSQYLAPLARDASVEGAISRSALLAFLNVVNGYEQSNRTPDLPARDVVRLKSGFLKHVRDLQVFGEERQYRQPSELPDDIDAVRVMTMHASKGLEFPVVYLPYLGGRYMPQPKQADECPPPAEMIANRVSDIETDELNVFFVALSRAQDALWLSRAEQYGDASSKASKFLGYIQPWLSRKADGAPWRPSPVDSLLPETKTDADLGRDLFGDRELDTYIRCPRQYYYDRVLRLEGRFSGNASLRFHRSIHRTLRWVEGVHTGPSGRAPAIAEIHDQLDSIWAETGPITHPYESLYRSEARRMVRLAADWLHQRPGTFEEVTLEIPVGDARVRFQPHQVERTGTSDGQIRRIRSGRVARRAPDDDRDALYMEGAIQIGGRVDAEAIYLGGSEVRIEPINLSPAKRATRVQHYREAIDGIRAGAFPARPSNRECPACPFLFICPAPEPSVPPAD